MILRLTSKGKVKDINTMVKVRITTVRRDNIIKVLERVESSIRTKNSKSELYISVK
jgi:hypothetical protein